MWYTITFAVRISCSIGQLYNDTVATKIDVWRTCRIRYWLVVRGGSLDEAHEAESG